MNFKQLLFEEEELNTPEKIYTAIKNGRVPGVKPNAKITSITKDVLKILHLVFKDFPSIHRNAAIKLAVKRTIIDNEKMLLKKIDAYRAYFNNRNKQEAKTTHKQLFTDFENGKITDSDFEDKIKELFKDKAKGKEETEKLFEDDNYLVVIPKNFAASCKYGEGTKWCTTGSERMFKNYSGQSPLIIVINKKLDSRTDPLAKVQFHGGTNNAMDAQDKKVELADYLDSLPSKIQEILKKHGFDKWHYLLEKAIKNKNLDLINKALKNIEKISEKKGYNFVTDAYYVNDIDVLRVLLNSDKIKLSDEQKENLFEKVADKNKTDIALLLLDKGFNASFDEEIVLRTFVINGNLKIVKRLIEKEGADTNVMNKVILELAARYNHLELFKYLVEKGIHSKYTLIVSGEFYARDNKNEEIANYARKILKEKYK